MKLDIGWSFRFDLDIDRYFAGTLRLNLYTTDEGATADALSKFAMFIPKIQFLYLDCVIAVLN